MTINCITIDDEPTAHSVLSSYIGGVNYLNHLASFTDPIMALNFLNTNNDIHFIFLDMKMDHLSGFDFIKSMNKKIPVIITTGYVNFACESYEFDEIIDYLPKPVSFVRFLKSINKILSYQAKISNSNTVQNFKNHLILKLKDETKFLEFNDITHIQAWGNYVKVYTEKEYFLTQKKMNEIEKELNSSLQRVHKSYIVNLNKIDNISGNTISLNELKIPIGNSFKQIFMKKLNEIKHS